MCRTCGAPSAPPLASRARRCSTPNRCCSSTTATANRANRTVGSISAWVPTTSGSSPVSRRASSSRRLAAPGRAGQQPDRGARAGEQVLERREVLLGERLRRRHQGRLRAGLERPQHRVEGDDGLPRADLPHQQALHRPRRDEVRIDLVEGAELIGGRLEGEAVQPGADELAGSAQPGRPEGRHPLAAPNLQRGLVEEQLLVGEATAGERRSGPRGGEVDRDPRVGGAGEATPHAHLARKRLDHVGGEPQRRPDPLADPLDPEALPGGMDRDDPGRVEAGRGAGLVPDRIPAAGAGRLDAEDLVGVGPEAAAVEAAAEQHPDARLQAIGQPGLVEPGHLHRAGGVGHGRLDDEQVAPAGRPQLRRPDLDHHRRLPADAQIGDLGGGGAIAVVVGIVLDEVPQRPQPDPPRRLRHLRPDPADDPSADARGGPADGAVSSRAAASSSRRDRLPAERARRGRPAPGDARGSRGHGRRHGSRIGARSLRNRPSRVVAWESAAGTRAGAGQRDRRQRASAGIGLGLPAPAAHRAARSPRPGLAGRRRDRRSPSALRVLETAGAPTVYVPLDAVGDGALRPVPGFELLRVEGSRRLLRRAVPAVRSRRGPPGPIPSPNDLRGHRRLTSPSTRRSSSAASTTRWSAAAGRLLRWLGDRRDHGPIKGGPGSAGW